MDIFKILDTYQSEIIDVWVSRLLSDQAAPYSHENESDLRPLVSQATAAYSLVLDGGGWDELDAFITFIARRRLAQGYKLSDVQKAFMLYQQVVTPLIIRNARDGERDEAIARLGSCISQTVGKFSDFFQGLHEEYMRQQTVVLENEVAKRTRELSESESKYKAGGGHPRRLLCSPRRGGSLCQQRLLRHAWPLGGRGCGDAVS
ncbi:RsbRD N-terminal domain-containing protein [Geotalea toluenoxydans]|uniref:RsbRD N-terminal domain-containing protein n=1 Tax=Geotalea toluenoxydans TaxID=421624 RepID=UPI0006CFA994|nr:RsbRD N-terminal domain-containing protein [Geotalea toluenoxydans]